MKKGPKRRKFPLIFILIIAVLLGGGMVGLFSTDNETGELEERAAEYFEAVSRGELTKAYYAYTSKNFQKETTLDSFKKGVKGYTLFQGAGSIQFNKRQTNDEEGFLQGIVKSAQGTQSPITLWFIKEEGEWKIDRMESWAIESIVNQKLI